jgi:iron complex outermembrane receptor protein
MYIARPTVLILVLVLLLSAAPAALAAQRGRITGSVRDTKDVALGGVTVVLERDGRTMEAQISDKDGSFAFEGVEPGSYVMHFVLGDRTSTETVKLESKAAATVDKKVDWEGIGFVETLVVRSASRKLERIVDTNSPVTTIYKEQVEQEAPTGQLPKLLEFTMGAQVTQSGLYDFNLNTRGFNSTLTRRVQTLVDGRDVSIPFLSSQEWALSSGLMDDLASVEFLRGPSAALHGANTFNGVLNLTTKAPKDSLGLSGSFAAGGPSSIKADVRWATSLGNNWYFKLTSDYAQSDDFTRSRNASVEYAGLAAEAVPVPDEKLSTYSTALRFDRYFGEEKVLTVEGGVLGGGNFTFVTPAGRSFITDVDRRWTRLNFNAPRFNAMASYDKRDAPDGINLAVPSPFNRFSLNDEVFFSELQGNMSWSKVRVVGGASFREERVDSANSLGNQTLILAPVENQEYALYGSVDADLTKKLKLSSALRWDASDLFTDQVSPKVALIYSVKPNHKLRLAYGKAFQRPNYGELLIFIPAGVTDFSFLNAFFPPGVAIDFSNTPILVLGNDRLKVERTRSWEAGYSGILGRRALVNANFYQGRIQDFITETLPGVNPYIPLYQAPASLTAQQRAIVEAVVRSVPGMSNSPTGGPLFTLSRGNAGEVDLRGAEIGLTVSATKEWLVTFDYSWFDFDKDLAAGITTANAPRHSLSTMATFKRARARASVGYRWVDGFEWLSGVHAGHVPSYDVIEVSGYYDVNSKVRLGWNVSNLFDKNRFQMFGGDLLRRRAVASITVHK